MIKADYDNMTINVYSQMGTLLYSIPFVTPMERSTAFHGARAWMKANQNLVYDVNPDADKYFKPDEDAKQYLLDLGEGGNQ